MWINALEARAGEKAATEQRNSKAPFGPRTDRAVRRFEMMGKTS